MFDLRYPFWHTKKISLKNCELSYSCRAPLWYSQNINIQQSKVYAVKAVRECSNVSFDGCDIRSPECFWFSKNISVKNSKMQGEYFMFKSSKGVFENLDFQGKYSFQYTKNLSFNNCVLFTKDAFWHAENVVVKNSVVTGEYLGWYSKNLTLENCEIRGTQPFCYCENLTLKNCKMIGCDLAFEKSSVKATVTTKVDSIKNPKSGKITLPEVGEIKKSKRRKFAYYSCSFFLSKISLSLLTKGFQFVDILSKILPLPTCLRQGGATRIPLS